eukprot:5761428-Amphidinium_carterae.1
MLAGKAKSPNEAGFRCEQDALGRYVLDGPANLQAFNILMECLQKGHALDVTKGHALERDIQDHKHLKQQMTTFQTAQHRWATLKPQTPKSCRP